MGATAVSSEVETCVDLGSASKVLGLSAAMGEDELKAPEDVVVVVVVWARK